MLKEGNITSNAGNTLINCERETRSVLNGIKNEFTKVYSLTQDAGEGGFHDAISAFRDLMSKFTHHEYEIQIHNAYKPIIDAFIGNIIKQMGKIIQNLKIGIKEMSMVTSITIKPPYTAQTPD